MNPEEDHVKLIEEDSAESVAGQLRKRGSFGEFHPRMVTRTMLTSVNAPTPRPRRLGMWVANGHTYMDSLRIPVKRGAFCHAGVRAAIHTLRLTGSV